MNFEPEWLHMLQHALFKELKRCKSCGKSQEKLYHCSDCMIGVYCSVQCQARDTEHPCLIGVKGRGDDLEEEGSARHGVVEERQLGDLEVFPKELLLKILEYTSVKDIGNVRSLSRALNDFVLAHPKKLPYMRVELDVDQMYAFPPGLSPFVGKLTIEHAWLLEVQDLDKLADLFPNLQYLDLDTYDGNSIDALSRLTNLQFLNLSNYDGDSIDVLSSLTKLKSLYLSYYQGDSIDVLSSLTKLKSLYLNRYRGKSINVLSRLTKLKSLKLNMYRGDSIDVLSRLINLEYLDLRQYRGDSIDALSRLINLEYLDLRQYRGDSIDALYQLTNLKTLYLDNYEGDSIDALRRLTKLELLYLNSYNGYSINALRNLTKLEYVNLYAYSDQAEVEELRTHLQIRQ
jgi:hypothetical protein